MSAPLTVEILSSDLNRSFATPPFKDLGYGSVAPAGYANCNFTISRDPLHYYDDLAIANALRVRHGSTVCYEGEITDVDWKVAGGSIIEAQVIATGYSAKLKQLTTSTGVAAGAKGSTWLTATMLADAAVDMKAGEVDTSDYTFPSGIPVDAPTDYWSLVESINAANGYLWKVAAGRLFVFRPKATAPDYFVSAHEADIDVSYTLDGLENYIPYIYTTDGATYTTAVVSDSASILKYGRRSPSSALTLPQVASSAQALQVATTYLNEHKTIRPRCEVATSAVRDASGNIVPPATVTAGGVLALVDMFATSQPQPSTLTVGNLSTFEVVGCDYDAAADRVRMSPSAYGFSFDKLIAIIESRQKKK